MRLAGICGISTPLGMLSPTPGQVSHPLLTRSPLYSLPEGSFLVRLACLIHAANVRSEPGSNSPLSRIEWRVRTLALISKRDRDHRASTAPTSRCTVSVKAIHDRTRRSGAHHDHPSPGLIPSGIDRVLHAIRLSKSRARSCPFERADVASPPWAVIPHFAGGLHTVALRCRVVKPKRDEVFASPASPRAVLRTAPRAQREPNLCRATGPARVSSRESRSGAALNGPQIPSR